MIGLEEDAFKLIVFDSDFSLSAIGSLHIDYSQRSDFYAIFSSFPVLDIGKLNEVSGRHSPRRARFLSGLLISELLLDYLLFNAPP